LNKKNQKSAFLVSLEKITTWLDHQKIPYMIIGGIANTLYGNPRQTFDIDIKISLDIENQLENFLDQIKRIARIIPEAPHAFIKETFVLPIEIKKVRIDLIFANLPFEIEAIQRSQEVDFLGVKIRVCTVEDFIIQKVVSTRKKDWGDIETVILVQKENIDWPFLLKHCEEFEPTAQSF